jgi:chromosome segregation ATPase
MYDDAPMTTKDEYVAKLKAQLDEWQEDMERLKDKAEAASDDAKVKIHEQIAELRAKWDEGHAKRQELLDAADEKWDAIKDEAEEKWDELKVAVKDSIAKIKSHF